MPRPTDVRLGDDAALLDSPDAAASRVLSPLRNTLAKLEQGGVLLQSPDGKYSYTTPVDQSEHGGSLGVHHPPGWKVAGIFHSHLANDTYDKNQFSDTDLDQANKLNVPSYVLFQNSGDIRAYRPGSTSTSVQNFGGNLVRGARGDALSLPQSASATAYPIPDYNQSVAQALPPREQMLAQALRTPDAKPTQD